MTNLSISQLKRAVQLKEQIAKLEGELSSVFRSNGSAQRSTSPKPAAQKSGGGSTMSPAARARLSAMAKARWAKIKAGNKAPATKAVVASKPAAKAPSARKPMSAAARARLSALMKAKWAAKVKAAGK